MNSGKFGKRYIKNFIPIYQNFRYFRQRYDTIRYIDIESNFRCCRYIEAALIDRVILILKHVENFVCSEIARKAAFAPGKIYN